MHVWAGGIRLKLASLRHLRIPQNYITDPKQLRPNRSNPCLQEPASRGTGNPSATHNMSAFSFVSRTKREPLRQQIWRIRKNLYPTANQKKQGMTKR